MNSSDIFLLCVLGVANMSSDIKDERMEDQRSLHQFYKKQIKNK
jgi:hypothetical protein